MLTYDHRYTETFKVNFLSVGVGFDVVDWGSVVSWGWSWVVWLSFWVYWGSFVFDISDESVVVVSGVGDSLDTSVGKVDLVRSRGYLAIRGFLGVEVSLGVVISNSVLESEWGWGVFFFVVNWGMIRCWSWSMIRSWSWSVVWSWGSWHSSGGTEESEEGDEGVHDDSVLNVVGSKWN